MMDFKINLDSQLVNVLKPILEKQEAYINTINTERLILQKDETSDVVSIEYSILLKDTLEKIGKVVLLYDGEIWYKIEKTFRKKGYATEAVSKLIEISKETNFYLSIDFKNRASRKVAKKLGFTYKGRNKQILFFIKIKQK